MADTRPGTPGVAVLIATKHRNDLLRQRALLSVSRQRAKPSRVIVVEDSGDADDAAKVEHIIRSWQPGGVPVDFLRNRRTPGAAGAWNTGLDHLARLHSDPREVLVAILDDDDEWEPEHIAACIERIVADQLDVVAAPFLRIEEQRGPRLIQPPPTLDASQFMVGNPGIQGSNLVARLSTLLEAGLFDESLMSCTDRDLCIRLADLPNARFGITKTPSVRHYACASRTRLSTPRSPDKLTGLDCFFRKYRSRMSPAQLTAFTDRAQRYFGWKIGESTAQTHEPPVEPLAQRCVVERVDVAAQSLHLIVGVIADTGRLASVSALLGELTLLAQSPTLDGYDVLLLENGSSVKPDPQLAALVAQARQRGVRVHLVDRARHVADAAESLVPDGGARQGHRLAIAPARTVLQSYLYSFAIKRPGAVVWILDDDMRLDPLTFDRADHGRLRRRRQDFIPMLRQLRERGVDVAIGSYTGAAPLPFASTVRVQLVDLVASLQWLLSMSPADRLPDRSAHNAALRVDRRDYYYDLSRLETDRLETPFLLTPRHAGETVAQATRRLARSASRILAGEQVFRPLAVDCSVDPTHADESGLLRGGNTFVFDVEALRDAPNVAPTIDQRPSRRSDMLWSLLQRDGYGRSVVTVPIGVYHDRSDVNAGSLDITRVVDDIRGYAMFSALADISSSTPLTPTASNVGIDIMLVVRRVHKYLDERIAAFRLSFHRIRGLARVLQGIVENPADSWLHEPAYHEARTLLTRFCELVNRDYTLHALHAIERRARRLDRGQICGFISQLPDEITRHQRRLSDRHALAERLVDERIANAHATVARLASPVAPLRVLGHGAEGVVFTDHVHVFKVFDYWKSRVAARQRAFLGQLVGAWDSPRCLYPLLALYEDSFQAVLIYSFESTEPYRGGCGPGLVSLLHECWRYRVICRNLHPDNLRVIDGRVRLIDYGSDIHPRVDDGEFEMMCRRAYLSFRWSWRKDLKALMRRALTDSTLPELEGFDRFYEAVRRVCGSYRDATAVELSWALQRTVGRALDYGCGKGKLVQALAHQVSYVLGYDPDPAHQQRWSGLGEPPSKLRFTNHRADVLTEQRFDVAICRRVLCTIESTGELRQVLDDLRASVADHGRVIVSVCNPHFIGVRATPEAERCVPSDADPERTFIWHKTVRATGRRRRDVHRPERILRREFARAGLQVIRRFEVPTVNLDRFDPASDMIVFELEPLPVRSFDASLMIKACAMEAETLAIQVRHIVSQLEVPRVFVERLLVLDTREDDFLRQHTHGDLNEVRRVAQRLVDGGWIDRIIDGPADGECVAAVNQRWFGIECPFGHDAAGGQIASTLAGFDACVTRYVLQLDADIMIGRLSARHDYLADMLDVMERDPDALTVSFNIAKNADRPYHTCDAATPWRLEVRAALIDLHRLRAARPLPNEQDDELLARHWHRSVDLALQRGAGHSYRGGDHRTFFVHPPNDHKADKHGWFTVLDRLEHGVVASAQINAVDWLGGRDGWSYPRRGEPFIFIVAGRNVPPGRFRRCLDSMLCQRGPRWGAIFIDDASEPALADYFERACESLCNQSTVIRNRYRRGLLANMVTAIRNYCTQPDSVIITLDADDALIGDQVLIRVEQAYAAGADMTVGSMLRTDKLARYPVTLDDPRQHRGGNVWQHLRTFKKRLFDNIPDEALRLDGEYVDLANDWAFMLPIVESAERPVYIDEPLYLHEPSGVGKGDGRLHREGIIGRIVSKPALAKMKRNA